MEKALLEATLCFLLWGSRVLLARKWPGAKIGAWCWNGYGGMVNLGESVLAAAIREIKEEAGISVVEGDLKKAAIAVFERPGFVCKVHVFLVKTWTGVVQETAEMLCPTWFDISNLPLEEMMTADRLWVEAVLSGKKVFISAQYGQEGELIGEVKMEEVDGW